MPVTVPIPGSSTSRTFSPESVYWLTRLCALSSQKTIRLPPAVTAPSIRQSPSGTSVVTTGVTPERSACNNRPFDAPSFV